MPRRLSEVTSWRQGRPDVNVLARSLRVSYGYDADGNKIAMTDATGSSSYAYDADGEQLSATQGSTTIASSTWNGAGELTSYSDPNANMTSATYDGDGPRASETSVPNRGSQVTQDFVWNTTSSVPSLLMDSTNAYIFAEAGPRSRR
jgi:YD repeat-containing protein